MSGKGPILGAVVLAALLASSSARHGGTGDHAAAARSGYVNPLAGGQWTPARTDQGVDYHPAAPEPVRAIGAGVVIYSSSTDCPPYGWPACHVIGYKLTKGPKAGGIIFVAEHLTGLLPAGARLWPGRVIATAIPGYPWIETGWANCTGNAPAVRYDGAADGTRMPGGLAYARFMRELGQATAQDPGPGPDIVRSC